MWIHQFILLFLSKLNNNMGVCGRPDEEFKAQGNKS